MFMTTKKRVAKMQGGDKNPNARPSLSIAEPQSPPYTAGPSALIKVAAEIAVIMSRRALRELGDA